jgi:protein SCO1/2
VIALVLACLLGCASAPDAPEAAAPVPSTDADAAVLYDLDVPLVSHDGATIGMDVYRGHPTLVAMFYGSCPSACPMLVTRLQKLERELDPDVRAASRVLLVSLDPDRDDPEKMRSVAHEHEVDLARWTLSAPPKDRVREIAVALGVRYAPAENAEIAHSSVLTLVDGQGRIVARADGAAADLSAITGALRALTRSVPRGTPPS